MQELIDALIFYADPETYFAIGFFPDPPCGDFVNDFDETGKPGALARKTLREYQSRKPADSDPTKVQKLKSEIASLTSELEHKMRLYYDTSADDIIKRMKQLSAA